MKNVYTFLFASLLVFSITDVQAQTPPCSLSGAVVTVPYSAPPIMMHAAVNGISQYTYGWNDGTSVGSSSQKPFYSGWCVTITDLSTGCDTTICESCIPNGGVGPCSFIYDPVCGCDGMQYGNPCIAMQQGIFTYTSTLGGTLPCTLPIPSWDCVNGACIDPNSGNGQYASVSACLMDSCSVVPPAPSWDCINGTCIDPQTGFGQYPTLNDCVFDSCAVMPPVSSWDCINGTCIDPQTGFGQYPTLNDCVFDSCAVMPPTSSWDCINGTCIDPQTGFGQYPTLNDCVFDSCDIMPPVSSWDCIPGQGCYDPLTGMGMYSSQAACDNVCIVNAVEEQTTNKNLLKITDLLGRETKGSKNDVFFYIYDDGTVEKRIVIE